MGRLGSSRKRGLNAWLTIEWHGLVSNYNAQKHKGSGGVSDHEMIPWGKLTCES